MEHEDPIDVRVVDNTLVLMEQVAKLEKVKSSRDPVKVCVLEKTCDMLTLCTCDMITL